MKTKTVKFFKFFVVIFTFQLLVNISNAQDPHPDRGLYVDKFFKFYLGTSTVDPSNTILGNTAKENTLLDYCKVNHITHLALYDVGTILSAASNTYRTQLCTFLHTARNSPYCINTIGATGGSENFFCNLFGQPNNCNPNPFAPITLSSAEQSLIASYSSDLLTALTDATITSSDPNYSYSQFMRYIWSAMGIPFSCGEQFDFMSIELEFWNASSGANYATDFKKLMRDVNWIKQNVPLANGAQIELYLGRMTDNYNNGYLNDPELITGFIDGYSNGTGCPLNAETRKVDRELLHCYIYDPTQLYSYSLNKNIRITQVYGGGGLPGSTYQNDFVELHNTTSHSINLGTVGISLQYSTGTVWTSMNLTGSIAAGKYYLVQLGPSSANGAALPTPNFSNPLDIDETSGKIALVQNTTVLSGSCPNTNIIDFVGYGSASCYEGTGDAPSGNLTTSILRIQNGCTEFGDNSSDFYINTPPTPRNSSTAANICTGGLRTDYFKDPCTYDATVVHPILSAERVDLGGDGDFTGAWIRDGAQRNIFEAERLYYQSFVADNNHTSSENVITPGAVMWFAQSFMQNHIVNPILFTTNSPVCASGGNGIITFDYRGPIEQGINYSFTVTGSTPTTSSGTLPLYNGTGFAISLPSSNRPTGTYTATLTLDYGCGTYSYSTPVKVVSGPTVDILTQSGNMCEGEPVLLQATAGTSYSWNTGATTQQITVSNTGSYTCTVTGGNCSGIATSSVTMLSNPDFVIDQACPGNTGNTIDLTINPYTTGTISWNTNQSSQTISATTSNNYIATVTQPTISGVTCIRQHNLFLPTFPIAITPQPTVSPSGPFSYCTGQGTNHTLQLSNPNGTYSGVTYSWLPGGETTTSISPINPNASTNYSIRVYKYGCYSESNPVIFTVSPLPTASFVATPICQGSALTINLTGTPNWTLVYNDVGGNHTISNITASPYILFNSASAGTYTLVSVSDGNGCSSVLSGQATVLSAPSISLSPNTSICSGSSVSLSASGANSFSWNPSSSITCQNVPCSLVTAHPLTTTSYIVTGTTGACSASATVSVTVNNLPSVSITPPNPSAICFGDNLILTASPGGTLYSWSTGLSCATCSTTTVSPLVTTPYIVVMTGSNNCTNSASVTVSVNSACCGGGTLLDQAYFNSHPTINAGVYNLNSNITLIQSTVLNNCQITVATGVSISTGIFTLTLQNGSTISSCSNMWRGIIVNGGGNFTTLPSAISCKIYDAQYGVDVRNGGNINVDKCEFINDWIGINLADAGSAVPITVNGFIKNARFYTSGALKPGNPSGIPYYQYSHSFAGIRAMNVSFLSVGINDGLSVNYFYDLNYGIYSSNSNLVLTDYSFHRIKKYDNGPSNADANAIISFGSAVFSRGDVTANFLTATGRKSTLDPDFQECRYGINSSNSSVDIQNNRIENCDFGIYVSKGNSLRVKAIKNYIDCNIFGISLILIDRYSNSFLQFNEIYGGLRATGVNGTSSAATGINVAGYNLAPPGQIGLPPSTNAIINQNTIHLYDYGLTGIKLNAIKSSIVNFNYVTLHNLVNNTMKGISLSGSQVNNISCNSVQGTYTSQIIYFTGETAFDIYDSRSNDIKCNSATQTSNGIRFSGTCHGGITPTTLRSNDIGNHYNGLVYTASALVDPQLNMGNWWYLNTYAGYAATNLNPSPANVANEKYEVFANLSSHQNLPVVSEINAVAPWFTPVLSDDANCGNIGSHRSDCNLYTEPYPGGGGSNAAEYSKDEMIALDQINSSSFNEETKWKDKEALYEKLMKMPDYKDEHPVLSDFFQNMAGSTLQQVATINVNNDDITLNQEALLQTIENNSISIYEKADTIRSCDSTLSTDGLDETQKVSVNLIRASMINQINQLIDFNKLAFETLKNLLTTKADLLNNENNVINSSEIFEQNEKVINEIYINGIVKDNPAFFYANSNNILAVAEQCPLAGGPAVHRARSLYMLVDPEMQYNDDLACLQSGWLLRTASKRILPIGVFPNPASSEVTITYNIEREQILQIVDGLGRISMSFLLNPKESRTTRNISTLSDGIYTLRISGSDNMGNNFGRLTIIR